MMKHFKMEYLLWLSLILALVSSLNHVAFMYAYIDGNVWMGWANALAIDLGIVSMSYSIKQRKAAKRKTTLPYVGLTLFGLVTVYANLAYGFVQLNQDLPRFMHATLPYVLAMSTPILVMFLAHVVSDNVEHNATLEKAKAKQDRTKAKTKEVQNVANVPLSESLVDELGVTEPRAKRLAYIVENRHMTNAELAKATGRTTETIRKDVELLNGRVTV